MNPIVTFSKRCAYILIAASALCSVPEATAQKPGLFELWVGHELVDCPSDPARLCYLVKNEQYDEWEVFEGSISNFYYREGVAYILLVEMNPAIGDSEPRQTRYRVVQVLEEFDTFSEPETPDRAASNVEEIEETVELAVQPEVVVVPPPPPPPMAAEETVATLEPDLPPPTAPDPVPAAKVVEAAPLPPPVSSSVARGTPHRGTLIIGSGAEARSFTPCGADGGIWIEDESGADLWTVYRERVEAPNQPLLIDIRGELGAPPLSGFGAHYDRQLTVFEVVRVDAENTDCASMATTSVAEAPAATVVDRPVQVVSSPPIETIQILISGGPPAWTLSIGSDGLVYSSRATAETVRFPYASPERSANRAIYLTSVSGASPQDLKVVIDREPCPDPETGMRRDFTAYITLDGHWLRGCVGEGDPFFTP